MESCSTLVQARQAKVGQLLHPPVLFPVGQSALNSVGRRDLLNVYNLLSTNQDADKKMLLIGRASKIRAHEPNRELPERRVKAVRDELINLGLSPSRIKSFWLGWEQPYLSKAGDEQYQIPEGLFPGDEIYLNQSVLLCCSEPPPLALPHRNNSRGDGSPSCRIGHGQPH